VDLTSEERPSDSPFVEHVWRSQSDQPGAFISMAEIHCGIVLTKFQGKSILTVRGPETRATPAYVPADAEFIGITFKAGVFMPTLPANRVMDRNDVNLPEASSQSFWLQGSAWQFPEYENADTFVDWLARDGLLVHDPVVDAAIEGQPIGMSLRTVQRRFLQATGLTQGAFHQIERARYATRLLKKGVSILDTVYEAGYFDQPHLTRALKHYIGLTPAQIADENRTERLSLLYNTEPLLLDYDTNVRVTAEGELTWERKPSLRSSSPALSPSALGRTLRAERV
jgi:AraC-like DNA-binding protein